MLPAHFFLASDGALHDKRRADCFASPLRSDYSRTHARITSTLELRATLRAGSHVWPGGYPLYFLTDGGEALSFETVREEYRHVSRAIRTGARDGWRVVACDVNWEDSELACAHSGRAIPAAYTED